MNPDQTPASHLPAPLPSPAALLHRTQAALGLLRDVVQESSAEYWYERGKATNRAENWSEATTSFRACIVRDTYNWRAMLHLTVALIHQQKKEAALTLLRAHDLGQGYSIHALREELSESNWRALQNKFRVVSQLSKDKISIRLALAVTSRILREPTLARQEMSEIRELYPIQIEKSAAWYIVSGILWSDLKWEKATKESAEKSFIDYNQAIKLDPSHLAAYCWRAMTKSYLGDKIGAITDCEFAIAIDPKYANAYSIRGAAKEFLGDKLSAINDYNTAISLSLDCARAYCNRGKFHLNSHCYKDAVSDYKHAISLNKIMSLALSGDLDLESVKHDIEVLSVYDLLVEAEPDSAYSYKCRAEARFHFGDIIGAIIDYDRAIEIEPNYSWYYKERALIKEHYGDTIGATADRQKYTELITK